MELFSALITGANRGIGLEFVRQLAHAQNPPKHVFATYRNPDTIKELETIKKSAPSAVQVHLVKFDVRSSEDLSDLKNYVENTVGEKGLTLLINNAGIAKQQSYPDVTADNLNLHLQVNTIGPILVAQAFLPLLKNAASLKSSDRGMSFSRAGILNLSSMVGSIANTGVQFTVDLAVPSYKTSKAALNMAMRVMAAVHKNDNVIIVNMCPGWVKTDMGTAAGEISVEESISAMLNTISKLSNAHSGTYLDRFGNPIPW